MIPKRIALVGPVASGKSTLAAEIAGHTGLPHLDLDDLFWAANWTPVSAGTFQSRVGDALAARTWIADGNYSGPVSEMLLSRAELAIWLDLPSAPACPGFSSARSSGPHVEMNYSPETGRRSGTCSPATRFSSGGRLITAGIAAAGSTTSAPTSPTDSP